MSKVINISLILCTFMVVIGCELSNRKAPVSVSWQVSVCDWIEQQQEIMEKRSNHYGIHVELRCQWADYGYSFHDRFLMVLNLDQDTSSVWSLGTSVNSLGNKHHIIQSVEHPQMMIDAFEELWNELDAPECLVWKKGV